MNSQNGSRALIGRRHSRTFNKERGRKDKCKKGGIVPPPVAGGKGGGGVRREKHVFTTITRALLSKNKNRKKLLSLRSRPGLLPPRNVNANLVKILVSPPQLSSGGRGSRGRRRSRSRDTSIATRLGAALPPLTAPGVQTHNHTPQNQPFPLGPHAPTSGLGSLETVLEA